MARTPLETPAEAVERVRHRIRVEGVDKAVTALIGACDDPKTPVTAKVQAGTALLRAGGLFDKPGEHDGDEKEPHEMSAAELARAVRRLKAQLANPDPSGAEDEGGW